MTLSKAERNRKYERSAKGRLARDRANKRFREKQGTVAPKERQRMEMVKTDEQIIEAMELAAYEEQAVRPEEPPSVEEEKARSLLFGKR
jgi:hypothetical protein